MKGLGEALWVYCWSFLDWPSIATLEQVCKDYRLVLNTATGATLFESMDLSQSKDPSVVWLLRKVICFQPKALILGSCDLERHELLAVLERAGEHLTILDLSFTKVKSQDIPQITSFCDRLEDLRLDRKCKKDPVLTTVLRGLPGLKRLSIRYNSFLRGEAMISSEARLESLAIEECQNFEYEAVAAVAMRSGRTMKTLSIDGEAYSTEQVCRLVSFLPCLTSFSISFANEITDPLLSTLTGYPLLSLHIKKGLLFTSRALQSFFSAQYPTLQSLELIECAELDDYCLFLISENCPDLRSINLSWCTEIGDEGMREIVRRCSKLRRMELVGLKSVTDTAFPLTENLKIYESLLSINFTKSDYVSDAHLTRISDLYPQIQLKNYYGEGKGNWRCSK